MLSLCYVLVARTIEVSKGWRSFALEVPLIIYRQPLLIPYQFYQTKLPSAFATTFFATNELWKKFP